MCSFWESSWKKVDLTRVTEYVDTFDMDSDDLIAIMRQHGVQNVCDAGCGCGIYALKLAANGFHVSGFDVSAHAVEISQNLLKKASLSAELKTASILKTEYADEQFDCVLSRDVLDHMSKADATIAIKELCRIANPNGIILLTLDYLDEEYQTEPHIINSDGDYVYTNGKWKGMVFHPYNLETIYEIVPSNTICDVTDKHGELTVLLRKQC
ncbi:MAG: class I SAM-dependent methyltransferase [Lachnospiraceae bacterium]|nr:class I SAM-dependent methyltransferase [Lachnospiraceae bacterium]